MAKNIHKGTEYNNINETWDQNEKRRESGAAPRLDDTSSDRATTDNDLQQVIQEEAAEYDNANKEERILGGDRATVNDDNS
jgi:hypothetical protein